MDDNKRVFEQCSQAHGVTWSCPVKGQELGFRDPCESFLRTLQDCIILFSITFLQPLVLFL